MQRDRHLAQVLLTHAGPTTVDGDPILTPALVKAATKRPREHPSLLQEPSTLARFATLPADVTQLVWPNPTSTASSQPPVDQGPSVQQPNDALSHAFREHSTPVCRRYKSSRLPGCRETWQSAPTPAET